METCDYSGIIYKYTSPSGKVYIGQTARPSARRAEHKCHAAECNTVFQKAIKKYGWENFKYEVIYQISCASKAELSTKLGKLEQETIAMYNSIIPNGYNQAAGGSGPLGHIHTESTKKKMSNSHKGILHTEEEKRKIAASNTGKVKSKEIKEKIAKTRSIPIVQLSLEGEFIREFTSAKVAAEILGLIRSNITACCRNRPKVLTVGGFKWKYKKDYNI